MIDQDFCDFLEYEICQIFQKVDNDEFNGFWCDGVLLSEPAMFYSQKSINDNRQVKLKAFIGKNGQTEYELMLKFGNKSLSRYARGLSIKAHMPSFENFNWFKIDTLNNKIEIQLD